MIPALGNRISVRKYSRLFFVVLLQPFSQIFSTQLTQIEHLEGIEAFQIIVRPIPEEIEDKGLTTAQIKKDAEEELKLAGITLSEVPGTPFIYVAVNIYRDDKTNIYPFNVSATVNHLVELKGQSTWVKIWMVSFVALTEDLDEVRKRVKEIIDKLIEDYQSANPK